MQRPLEILEERLHALYKLCSALKRYTNSGAPSCAMQMSSAIEILERLQALYKFSWHDAVAPSTLHKLSWHDAAAPSSAIQIKRLGVLYKNGLEDHQVGGNLKTLPRPLIDQLIVDVELTGVMWGDYMEIQQFEIDNLDINKQAQLENVPATCRNQMGTGNPKSGNRNPRSVQPRRPRRSGT